MTKTQRWSAIEVIVVFTLVMLDIWVFYKSIIPWITVVVALIGVVMAGFIVRVRSFKKNLSDSDPAFRNAMIIERTADYTQELGLGRWRRGALFGWYCTHLDCTWAWRLMWSSGLALVLILIAGYFFKPEFWEAKGFWDKKLFNGVQRYIWWGMIQQFFLQGYVTNKIYSIFIRKTDLLGLDKRAAWLTAVCSGILFFLAHIPNPTLMVVTPIVGAASAFIFLNCRNIYILGIAHGFLGTVITYCLANNMRVGPHYWVKFLN